MLPRGEKGVLSPLRGSGGCRPSTHGLRRGLLPSAAPRLIVSREPYFNAYNPDSPPPLPSPRVVGQQGSAEVRVVCAPLRSFCGIARVDVNNMVAVPMRRTAEEAKMRLPLRYPASSLQESTNPIAQLRAINASVTDATPSCRPCLCSPNLPCTQGEKNPLLVPTYRMRLQQGHRGNPETYRLEA